MKKSLLSIAVTVVALAFALPTFADTNTPANPPTPKPAKVKTSQFTGDIKSIDATTHAVTVVNAKSEEKTFALADGVKIATKAVPKAQVSDLKVGDKVKVIFTETNGVMTASRIGLPDVPKKPKADATAPN